MASFYRQNIATLIEAHRRADAELEAASLEVEAAQERARESEPEIMVPFGFRPDGQQAGYLVFDELGEAQCSKTIREFHGKKRRMLAEPWIVALGQQAGKDIATEIDASESRALLALASAVEQHEAHLVRCGVRDADRAFVAAHDDENCARLALLLARPSTDEEAKMKAEYVATAEAFGDYCLDDDGGKLARLALKWFAGTAALEATE